MAQTSAAPLLWVGDGRLLNVSHLVLDLHIKFGSSNSKSFEHEYGKVAAYSRAVA